MTADGVPVIWHDDYVVTRGPGGRVVKRLIAQLTLAEFKGLARPPPLPPRDTPGEPPGAPPSAEAGDAAACSGDATASGIGGGQQGAAGRGEGGGPGEGGGRGEGGWQLARLFRDTAGRPLAGVQPWAVYIDDDLPTLAEVFQVRPALSSRMLVLHLSFPCICNARAVWPRPALIRHRVVRHDHRASYAATSHDHIVLTMPFSWMRLEPSPG